MESKKLGSNYTLKENILRVFWGMFSFFFRYSPRHFYAWRNFLLRLFSAKIGKGVKIYPSAKIMFPWNLEIGNKSVISWEVILYDLGTIKIGNNTIISQYAHICAGTHDYKTSKFTLLKTPVTIGDNVWIATDAFIGPGVIVGDNAIVAARSVVISNVPDNKVVGGNPAIQIKDRN